MGLKGRLRHYWMFLRESLWFVPLLMSIAAMGLAVLLVTEGDMLPDGAAELWLIYSGDPESARQLLGALLSGIITMTSLVVSITVVVLTLAAGQLGPRLVRNFIGDPQTQTVLGLFVATILYLLVIFRSIGAPSDNTIPHLAISVGTALSALCLFVLLFFVHKLARSIMYDNAVRAVSHQLRESIELLLPEGRGPEMPPPVPADAARLGLGRDGYIQAVDFDILVRIACDADAVIWLDVRPGHFVLARGCHLAVVPPDACDDAFRQALEKAFIVGTERTPTQDLEYGIRQLVEMALRALSPGINDVYTALTVIDMLSSALSRIFDRPLEAALLRDGQGRVRVVRDVTDHDGLVRAAFDQIRQAGAGMPAVLIRVSEALAALAPYACDEARLRPLLDQITLIEAEGKRGDFLDHDRAALLGRCRKARESLTAVAGRDHRRPGPPSRSKADCNPL